MAQLRVGPEAAGNSAGAIMTPDGSVLSGGPPKLLRGLSPAQVERVVAAGRRKVVHRGERLFSQGQPNNGIYLVESGRVRVFYISPTGREITLAYWHEGNFVGGPEVYGRGRHMWSGVAATSARILHLPGDPLRQMAAEIPALASGIIDGLIFKAKCYSALAQMLGTRSATERLANLLLHLANLYGTEADGGSIQLATSLSHADLASMTGVTRQSVSTTLRKLSDLGLVDIGCPHLTICDPEGLEELSRGKAGASRAALRGSGRAPGP